MGTKTARVREVIRLADLTVASPRIADHRFEDCLILGPAVLATTGATTLEHCNFDGDVRSLLWHIGPDRPVVIGAIEAADCEFVRCRFSMVGFAGNDAFIEMFKKGLA